jgi:hypothetical protein
MSWVKSAALAPLYTFICGVVLAADGMAIESIDQLSGPRGDYVLNCGGCHGIQGVSNAMLIPSLKDLVGYYLWMPKGREYLSRVPGVAFSTLSDRKLAGVLNYVVFDLGGNSAPVGARPFSEAEVSRLRKQPLTEVSLSKYREQIVETLISQHQAPAALRIYGQ